MSPELYGFSPIDLMNVTAAMAKELSRIRVRLAREKTKGSRPPLAPPVPEGLDFYKAALLAFGALRLRKVAI